MEKSIFEYMEEFDAEQVVFCRDKNTGLRAIIVLHNTTLGPATGGTRAWPYKSEEEALVDCLRLAKGMTYKYAAAGINLGGGKAVILLRENQKKTESLFRALGRFVDTLGGRFITGEDVGVSVGDLEYINMETDYVVGLPSEYGGSGGPSPYTAYGVVEGMKVCCEEVFKKQSLNGRIIAVQGVGNVGYEVVRLLRKENVEKIIITDIDKVKVEKCVREFGCESVPPDKIYEVECDIFSPCALGGILNDETIPKLKCKIVAGGANNQLADEEKHDLLLYEKGILYAPDFVINAGQAVDDQDTAEPGGYNFQRAREKIDGIYDRIKQIIKISKEKKLPTQKCAYMYAEERIRKIRALKQVKLTKTRIPRW